MYEFVLESDKNICLIFAGQIIDLCARKPKVFQFEKQRNFAFQFFDKDNVSLMQNAYVNSAEKVLCASNNLTVVQLNQNLYFVKILAQKCCFFAKKVKKIKKNDIFFNFFQNGTVEIEDEYNMIFSENYDFSISDADVLDLKNDCYALKLFGADNKEKSIVLNQNFSSVLSFDSAVIEPNNKGFKVLTHLHDIACHGLVEVFEIGDEIIKTDEYSVYLKGSPQNKFNVNVLPIYFLQCIKANDYAEAKKCLSDSLLKKVKAEHLKTYFGDFVDILHYCEKIYLITPAKNKGQISLAREISFTLKDNKIDNVSMK